MADLTKEDVTAMGRAVGLEMSDAELTEVTHSLNALLESLGDIDELVDPDELDKVQPLPIIIPSDRS